MRARASASSTSPAAHRRPASSVSSRTLVSSGIARILYCVVNIFANSSSVVSSSSGARLAYAAYTASKASSQKAAVNRSLAQNASTNVAASRSLSVNA